MSLALVIIGVLLIGGSFFLWSLVDQAPTDEETWWQPIINALGEAAVIVAWIMLIIGIILLVIGMLRLVGVF